MLRKVFRSPLLTDTIRHLNSADFGRVRIGIGHPGRKDLVTDYVLSRPSSADKQKIEDSFAQIMSVMPQVLQGELQAAMKQLHSESE